MTWILENSIFTFVKVTVKVKTNIPIAYSPQIWLPKLNTDEFQLYAMRMYKRYSQCKRYQRDSLHRDHSFIYRDH